MSLLQHPHFRPRHYLGGSAVIFFIVLLYGFSLSAVFPDRLVVRVYLNQQTLS